EVEGERGETIWYLSGPGVAIGLREAQVEGDHDRYSVGVHHIAFEAWSRATVDERADWLRARGAEIESGPEEYGYQPGYYAVLFSAPKGKNLESAPFPDQAPRKRSPPMKGSGHPPNPAWGDPPPHIPPPSSPPPPPASEQPTAAHAPPPPPPGG